MGAVNPWLGHGLWILKHVCGPKVFTRRGCPVVGFESEFFFYYTGCQPRLLSPLYPRMCGCSSEAVFHKFWGQCTSPEPLRHWATQHLIENLTSIYFCHRVACNILVHMGLKPASSMWWVLGEVPWTLSFCHSVCVCMCGGMCAYIYVCVCMCVCFPQCTFLCPYESACRFLFSVFTVFPLSSIITLSCFLWLFPPKLYLHSFFLYLFCSHLSVFIICFCISFSVWPAVTFSHDLTTVAETECTFFLSNYVSCTLFRHFFTSIHCLYLTGVLNYIRNSKTISMKLSNVCCLGLLLKKCLLAWLVSPS